MLCVRLITNAARAAVIAGAVLALSGCGERDRSIGLDPGAVSAPVVRGVEAGLEARLWVVENRSGVLGGVLREFGPPETVGAGGVEVWQRNGFRVLEVPLDRLDGLRAGLPTIGPLHREWLGLLPEWVEVVKGSELAASRTVRFDSGSAVLGPGRLRLMARCWAVPEFDGGDEGVRAVLHVEVMPELGAARRAARGDFSAWLGEGGGPDGGGGGMAFDRLRLGVVSGGGSAIVIVPEEPGVDWDAESEGRPESGFEARQRAVVGPRMQPTPTLGELMLTSLGLPESVGDTRVMVVLVPRVPERFELLPRAR